MTERGPYTHWGMVGAGQSGRRIVTRFLERAETSVVGERVVLVETPGGVSAHSVDRVASALSTDPGVVGAEHVAEFGPRGGVGYDFFESARRAESDFETLSRRIVGTLDASDALLYVLGLGGGTGNGAVPSLVAHLSQGDVADATAESAASTASESEQPPWLDHVEQFALAAWPFESEPPQRHFNAVCGLSRLVACEDGSPNADMTMLASNSRVAERVGDDGEASERTDDLGRVNDLLAAALDLFLSSSEGAWNVVGPTEYVDPARWLNARHGTFGAALDRPLCLSLRSVLDAAAENAFVPLDPSTAMTAYAVVRAPASRIESGEVTARAVQRAFAEWRTERGVDDAVGMATLVDAPDRGETMDALVFLGGFDLEPLVAESREDYERVKATFADRGREDALERVERIEANLREYVRGTGGGS